MNALRAAENEPPSADLLLYLAEFADAGGKPEDPLAVDRDLGDHEAAANDSPDQAETPTETESKTATAIETKTDAKPDDDAAEPATPDAPR